MREQLSITIEAKVLGQRKSMVAEWVVRVPQHLVAIQDSAREGDLDEDHETLTLRDLLTAVVTDEVVAFHKRQQERRLALVISPAEIERGAALGKIDLGGREAQAVTVEEAIATALQAFEDRLYLVLLDGVQVDSLESELEVCEGSRLTFVRLVALVGG